MHKKGNVILNSIARSKIRAFIKHLKYKYVTEIIILEIFLNLVFASICSMQVE